MLRPRRIVKVTLASATAAALGVVVWVRSQARHGKHEPDPAPKRVSLPDTAVLAQRAYHAYSKSTNVKDVLGEPMPAWDDLGDPVQAAWAAATQQILNDCYAD